MTQTPTPNGEKFETTAVRWCPFCSGNKGLETVCHHSKVLSIDCPIPGTVIASGMEFISLLGVGGMGVVYKCRNIHLDKMVAVKMLAARRFRDDDVVRFQTEARTAGKFNHPNLVSVLDFGITDDAEPFMVMEYLEGKTLSKLLAKGELSMIDLISIFRDCCIGLAYAHEHGVLHRDLKPENIMIVESADQIQVKVLDFGIAKIADAGRFDQALTNRSIVFGTPPYMSPEQSIGEALSDRGDVYSLGCVMYEAFCGRRPFEAKSALELINLHKSAVPKLIGEIKPDGSFPEDLEILISSMLLKTPSDRPPMPSVADELGKILETLPSAELQTEISENSSIEPMTRLNARTRMILLVVVALLGLAISWFVFLSTSKIEKPLPVSLGLRTSIPADLDGEFQRQLLLNKTKDQIASDTISFSDMELYPEPLELMAKKAKNCESLRFINCSGLTPENLEILTPMKLKSLFIRGSDMNNDGLLTISNFKDLNLLFLERVLGIDNGGFKHIKRFCRLRELGITGTDTNSQTMKLLSESSTIRYLWIANNQKFDELALAPLSQSHMQTIKMDDLSVGDRGMELIAKIPGLTGVEVTHSKITDRGVESLCKAPGLIVVNVSYNPGITDRSVDSLERLCARANFHHSVHFYLDHTAITSASLPVLKKMIRVQTLRLSGLKGFNNKVLQELHLALPNTKIVFDNAYQDRMKQFEDKSNVP